MIRLLKIIAFSYGLGLLMLVGWRSQTQGDGFIPTDILFSSQRQSLNQEEIPAQLYSVNMRSSEKSVIAEAYALYTPFLVNNGWLFYAAQIDKNTDIYRLSIDYSHRERLTDAPESDSTPLLSADGNWLFFISWRTRFCNLYRMRVDGSDVEQLTFLESLSCGYRISANSNWLYFTTRVMGADTTYRLRPDGSDFQHLFKRSDENPVIYLHRVGDWIFVTFYFYTIEGENQLWRLNLDKHIFEKIMPLPKEEIVEQWVAYHPKWVLFTTGDSYYGRDLYRFDFRTQRLQLVVPFKIAQIRLTPRQDWIVFTSEDYPHQLIRMRPDGTGLKTLFEGSPRNLTFTPDGQYLTFINDGLDSSELVWMRLDGSDFHSIPLTEWDICCLQFISRFPNSIHTERLLGLGVLLLGGALVLAWMGRYFRQNE